MVPIYSLISIYLYERIKQTSRNNLTIQLVFFGICAGVTLILTPLFELRYFVIPWVMLSLEYPMKHSNYSNLLYFTVINSIVMWMFVKRPFVNPFFDNEMSRFFW